MSDTVYISAPKNCDLCSEIGRKVQAEYDARLRMGSWANVCEAHFKTQTNGKLGTGYGQRLIVGEEPERDRRAEFAAAAEAGDWDAMEDAMGDGDIADFL